MGKQILTCLCNTATQLLHMESLGAWQSTYAVQGVCVGGMHTSLVKIM